MQTKDEIIKQVRDADGSKIKVKFKVTPRQGIVAPKGRVLVALDYAGQELMLTAVISGDETMLDTYRQPEEIAGPDGKMYPNPLACLHTLTTAECCYPKLFLDETGKQVPHWRWRTIADDDTLITAKGNPRSYAKILNFGVIFNQGAESISEMHSVRVEEAKDWLKRHEKRYPGFHSWRKEVGGLADARGWMNTPYLKRIRGCVESNAKNSGESPAVLGVNTQIQASAADMTKLAAVRIRRLRESAPSGHILKSVRIVNLVHDEIVVQAAGAVRLDLEKSKWKDDVIIKPKWIPTDDVMEWAVPVREVMIKTETEILGGVIEGRVGQIDPCPFWSK